MRLQPNPFLSFLLNPLGMHARGIEHLGFELTIDARRGRKIHLRNLSAPPSVNKGLLGATVSIQMDDGSRAALKGVDHQRTIIFAQEVQDAWCDFNIGLFAEKCDEIDLLFRAVGELDQPTRYPAACALSPVLVAGLALEKELFSKLRSEAIGDDNFRQIRKIRDFTNNPRIRRDQAIEHFEREEVLRWQAFFDTVEKNPLTPEQRLSIVADEDATLVLAGAGSGKTSVITAKAAYLVKAGIRKPEEILLLAFARDAAKEMSERIETRCGEPLEARTFHALAYDIIGAVEVVPFSWTGLRLS